MFDGASLTIISGMDQDKLILVHMEVPLLFDVSSPSKYKSRFKKDMIQRKGLNSIYNCILE